MICRWLARLRRRFATRRYELTPENAPVAAFEPLLAEWEQELKKRAIARGQQKRENEGSQKHKRARRRCNGAEP